MLKPVPFLSDFFQLVRRTERVAAAQHKLTRALAVPSLPHDETRKLVLRGVHGACRETNREPDEDDGDRDDLEWVQVSASFSSTLFQQQLPHVARPR